MNVIPDDIDLSVYLRAADDLRVQVKPARAYEGELRHEFAPIMPGTARAPSMQSTKLRDRLRFRSGEVTVWAGYNGHRKSMLTGQIALDMLAQHEPVLMASFEMAPGRTLGRMVRQALGVETPTNAEISRFLHWSERLSIFDHKGKIHPERVIAVCRYYAEELRGRHAFIDSMMMICSSEEHLDEQKQFMTALVRTAIETGMHLHLIAHCRKPSGAGEEREPSKYDLRGTASISDQADNVCMIWMNQAKKGSTAKDRTQPDATVVVAKQRNAAWEGRAQLFFHDESLRFVDEPRDWVDPYEGLEA